MPPRKKAAATSHPKSTHVKPGETLASVAARLGIDVDTLRAVNGLREHDLIGQGTLLRSEPAE